MSDEFIIFAGEKVYLKDIRYIHGSCFGRNIIKIKRKSKFRRLKETHLLYAFVERYYYLLAKLRAYWERLENEVTGE